MKYELYNQFLIEVKLKTNKQFSFKIYIFRLQASFKTLFKY